MSKETHYDVLGIKPTSTDSEIKKAYRSMSLKYHPDRNPTDEAKTKMQDITGAYEILGDPESKKKYDMQLKFGGTNAPNMNEFDDINNIFNMMFQGFPGMAQQMQGNPNIRVFHNGMQNGQFNVRTNFQHIRSPDPINKRTSITLEQAYSGCIVEIEIERILETNQEIKKEIETMYINIPSGILHNETVTLHEKGNTIDSKLGHINITVSVETHPEFIRQGQDIIMKKTISLKESLCGFLVEFTYLNGKKLALNNNENHTVIKPGYKKIIPGMGITREGRTGNFIIHFDVEFPNVLSEEIRTQIKGIL